MYDDLSFDSYFFIVEVYTGSSWIPIGGVTLAEDCMPIVIGNGEYRGQGLAKKIILRLLAFAREKGFSEINLREIYRSNMTSIKLFERAGFKKVGETANGYSYKIIL